MGEAGGGYEYPDSPEDGRVSGSGEEYECWLCRGVFVKTRSDEEATAEMRATWNETSDPGTVCDDCFQQVMAWAQQEHPEFLR